VNIFLKDVVKHVKPDAAYKNQQKSLQGIVRAVLLLGNGFEKIVSMVIYLFINNMNIKEMKNKEIIF